MNRHNRILLGLLAVQLVILAIAYWPNPASKEGRLLFEDLEVEKIVRLTISDANNNEITIAKGASGWVMPDADDYPVGDEKVSSLLGKLVTVRADRLVTRTRESHARLEVADDDFQRLIEFELEDGTRHTLHLGSSLRFQVLHVRADGQDEVYLALGLSVSDAGTDAASWVDADYFSIAQNQIVSLILENRNGRFEFEKGDGDTWNMLNLPTGETLLENNVRSLATRVSVLRMVRPLGREDRAAYGIADPSAKFTVVTRDDAGNEQTHIVRVGARLEEENGFVVKSAASPYYVLMAEFTVQDLIERNVQDFIEVPPTPVPELEATPTPAP